MRRWWLLVVVSLVAFAGCGDSSDDDPAAPSSATESESVKAADSSLGQVVVDAKGMTLYLFTKDADGKSACEAACAELWPPLMAAGAPTAGSGVDASKLSTITRTDGSTQVALAGHPLYLYAKDTKPGDVTGQGVGGVWFAVRPDGTPVAAEGAAAAAVPAPTTTAAPTATTAARPGASTTTTTAARSAPTAPPTTASTAPPAGQSAAITIQNFSFSPAVLNIAAGTTVTATNKDGSPHTWTADNGSWNSGSLDQNESFSHKFTTAGTFPYHCDIHPSMKATVNVS
jgi:predicted lipoprotein with Yx(FWY)xxD motif/plastocyanin